MASQERTNAERFIEEVLALSTTSDATFEVEKNLARMTTSDRELAARILFISEKYRNGQIVTSGGIDYIPFCKKTHFALELIN